MKFYFLIVFSISSLSGVVGQWEPMDGPYGGYINDLKGNDVFQFAATPDGLFRTHNIGASWEKVTIKNGKYFACLQIGIKDSTVVVDLLEKNAGQIQRYLYESHDNGNTWKKLSRPKVDTYLSIAVNSFSIYLSDGSELWVSVDGGKSWTPSSISNKISYVNCMYSYHDRIYIGSSKKIFKSTDIQDDFDIITIPDLVNSVSAIYVFENLFLVENSNGIIYRSDNSGQSWTNSDIGLGDASNFVKIKENYFVFNYENIYKSEDQGKTWRRQVFNSLLNLTRTIINAQGALMLGQLLNGIIISKDEGLSFREANYGLHGRSVEALISDNDKLYAGESYKGISLYDTKTNMWDTVMQLKTKGEISDLIGINNNLLAITNNNKIFKKAENESVWKDVTPNDYPRIWEFFAFNQTVFAGDVEGNGLYRSTDSGLTWQHYNISVNGIEKQPRIFTFHDSILLTGNLSELFRSTDNGKTWNKSMEGIYFNQQGLSHFLRLYSFNDVFFALEFNDSIGRSSIELNVSYDNGAHWKVFQKGIPDHPFESGILRMTSIGKILIATMLNDEDGVYVSFDNAESWQPFNEGLNVFGVNEVAYDENYLYASTSTNGVWRRKISDLYTTSIYPISQSNEISIFPNPSNGNFTLNLNSNISVDANLMITDISGKVCFVRDIVLNSQSKVDASTLPSGLYFLSIRSGDKFYTGKIVIQH